MWFPLKKRYFLEKERIDTHRRWGEEGVIAIKKCAPIYIGFEGVIPVFSFAGALLAGLTFNDLKLPDQCVMDEEGSVFCSTNTQFVAIAYKRWLNPRINYCPGCGKVISGFPLFPDAKILKKYEVKRKK